MSKEEIADEALMQAFQCGDLHAFEQLLERHRQTLYNFLLRHTGDAAAAQEILHETFLRVLEGTPTFDQETTIVTWLFTMARKQTSAHLHQSEQSGASAKATRKSDAGSAEGNRPQQRVEFALAALKEEHREVILLREMADLTIKEIARVVGCTDTTVKNRMRASIEQLRRELQLSSG